MVDFAPNLRDSTISKKRLNIEACTRYENFILYRIIIALLLEILASKFENRRKFIDIKKDFVLKEFVSNFIAAKFNRKSLDLYQMVLSNKNLICQIYSGNDNTSQTI